MREGQLATGRLILRPPAPEDLPWLLAEMNTPAVLRFLGGAARPDEEVAQGLSDDIHAFAHGGHQRWTVCLRDSDERVGRVGLFHVRSPAAPRELQGQPEIGWTLAERHWGCGYATEAARAVLDYGFGTAGLALIYAQTSDSNGPSTRLIQRLGFLRRPELGYDDPAYPLADNPTTVWSKAAPPHG